MNYNNFVFDFDSVKLMRQLESEYQNNQIEMLNAFSEYYTYFMSDIDFFLKEHIYLLIFFTSLRSLSNAS